jgi:bifunctional DNase/RNase
LSSHVGKEAFEWKEESANVKRVMISGKETDVYLCGVVLEQEENEDLEFKSLKSELMIKNPEIV